MELGEANRIYSTSGHSHPKPLVHGWAQSGPLAALFPRQRRAIAEAAVSPATRPPASRSQKSRILNRTITLKGHKTGVSLEEAFWTALKEIAAAKNIRASKLVETIDNTRENINLSSAVRLYVLNFYKHKKYAVVRRSTKH
jgi:predicted DNA-binding ribbon-helix-helix protein